MAGRGTRPTAAHPSRQAMGDSPLFPPFAHSCSRRSHPSLLDGMERDPLLPLWRKEEVGRGRCTECNERGWSANAAVEILVPHPGPFLQRSDLPPLTPGGGGWHGWRKRDKCQGGPNYNAVIFSSGNDVPFLPPHFMPPDNHLSQLISRSSPIFFLP